MTINERRKQILQVLTEAGGPVSGAELSRRLHVSRQIIVQDIAAIRREGKEILSTNRGYTAKPSAVRVFKVSHSDERVGEELMLIVDQGAVVEDVFIYHKVYGVMRGELHIRSRHDVEVYLEEITSGKSSLLKNVTSGYHYHTVTADSEEILDRVEQKLRERNFLAPLQDYEPMDSPAGL
ncbi:MAG: transcription repressor NadR [Bilifractor sp.]|jgi:transcriptional regulator of NAD metabolism